MTNAQHLLLLHLSSKPRMSSRISICVFIGVCKFRNNNNRGNPNQKMIATTMTDSLPFGRGGPGLSMNTMFDFDGFDSEAIPDVNNNEVHGTIGESSTDCTAKTLPLCSRNAAMDRSPSSQSASPKKSLKAKREEATAKNTTRSPHEEGMLVAPLNKLDPRFVNVYMVVDPKSRTCLLPKQVISFQDHNNVVSTAVFGPRVLQTPPPGIFSTTTTRTEPKCLLPQEEEPRTTATVGSEPCSSSEISVSTSTGPLESTSMMPPPVSPKMNQPTVSPKMNNNKQETTKACNRPFQPKLNHLDSSSSSAAASRSTGGILPPLRALSAYNFFFRDERERILSGVEAEWTETKKQKLLEEHWFQDRHKKRRHRKTHGKIDFTSLSKLISSRWKELAESRKDFYRQVAARDFSRFKQESKSQQQQASTNTTAEPLPQDATSTTTTTALGSSAPEETTTTTSTTSQADALDETYQQALSLAAMDSTVHNNAVVRTNDLCGSPSFVIG